MYSKPNLKKNVESFHERFQRAEMNFLTVLGRESKKTVSRIFCKYMVFTQFQNHYSFPLGQEVAQQKFVIGYVVYGRTLRNSLFSFGMDLHFGFLLSGHEGRGILGTVYESADIRHSLLVVLSDVQRSRRRILP